MQKALIRLGGGALIIGSVMLLAGNLLHPRSETGFEGVSTGLDPFARLVTVNLGAWHIAHLLLVISFPTVLLGFVIASWLFIGRGEQVFSLTAILSGALATVLFVIWLLLDGFLTPFLANSYLTAVPTEHAYKSAIFTFSGLLDQNFLAMALFLFVLAQALYGLAIVKSRLYSSILGYVGLVLGAFGVSGYIGGLFGPYWVFSPLFPWYSLLVTLWYLAFGLFLYRTPADVRGVEESSVA